MLSPQPIELNAVGNKLEEEECDLHKLIQLKCGGKRNASRQPSKIYFLHYYL